MGGKVRRSIYRQPPSPRSIELIEKDGMDYFDKDVFPNVGTGLLEQYFDEKNRVEGFERSRFGKKIAIGIIIGCMFALINQYVGLKVGLVTGGSWYITYLLGLAMRWHPTETNIISGSATGTDRTCTGFVFTFPAIYLLAYSGQYLGSGGNRIVDPSYLSSLVPIALIASMMGGLLGITYFIIFRRIWLVEDPLPMPQIHAQIKLLDIAHHLSGGAMREAKKSIRIVMGVAAGTMAFVFLRDVAVMPNVHFPNLEGTKISVMDSLFYGPSYKYGTINITPRGTEWEHYTYVGFTLTPIQLALGWFLKFRTALLVSMGTLLTFFVIMPTAVGFDVSVYVVRMLEDGTVLEGFFNVNDPILVKNDIGKTAAYIARDRIGRIIAIGAILGGGFTALIKMAPVFRSATRDVMKVSKAGGSKRKDWIAGKGWYEWPVTYIPIMMVITFFVISITFILGGFPFLHSIIFGFLLVTLTFFLGAIAVKVSGEVGTTPVSGTSFITLFILIMIFSALPWSREWGDPNKIIVMALLGTAVFGSSISLSSDIMWDFRSGIYCGTRPYHLMKGESAGLFFGSTVSVLGATFFSYGLALGKFPDLEAPQAHAFATFTQILVGGGGELVQMLLFIGIAIGVVAELTTGMGTAFGLGMYLPLSYTLPLLMGGAARDIWEKYRLQKMVRKYNWSERHKTIKLLETFMIATGLLVGEALMGTINAIYIMFRGD